MTRISEAAAAQFLDYPKNLHGLVLVRIAQDWLLMTQDEYEKDFLGGNEEQPQ